MFFVGGWGWGPGRWLCCGSCCALTGACPCDVMAPGRGWEVICQLLDRDASALQLESPPLLLHGQELSLLGLLGVGRGVVVYRVRRATRTEDLVRGRGQGADGALYSAGTLVLFAFAAVRLFLPASA